MGWINRIDPFEQPVHRCRTPRLVKRTADEDDEDGDPIAAEGSVWECRVCMKRHRVVETETGGLEFVLEPTRLKELG